MGTGKLRLTEFGRPIAEAETSIAGQQTTTLTCGAGARSGAEFTAQEQSLAWQAPPCAATFCDRPLCATLQAQGAGWATQHARGMEAASAIPLQAAAAGAQVPSVGNARISKIARCLINRCAVFIDRDTEAVTDSFR
jgi:hypothetical protein